MNLQCIEQSNLLVRNVSLCLFAIRPSPINGRGVFSLRAFPLDHILYIPDELAVFPFSARGTIQRGPRDHVDDPIVMRWVNHSCRPNARICFSNNKLMLFSIATISPGAELTCDYGHTEDEIPMPFHCACGGCGGRLIGGRRR